IVKFRDDNGVIKSRDELKKVSGMGEKTFEQCAGFLKIPESANPLDNSWVHPERYALASEILPLVKAGSDPSREQRSGLKEKYGVGDTTIDDILLELKKPNRDPRDELPKPILSQGVLAFEDLKEGMKVTGKVKNVVDFGAFVDIGIKESALIHVSELSDRFVTDPMEVIKVGDVHEFRIISLDIVRKRIGLSLKSEGGAAAGGARGQAEGSGPNPSRRVVAVRRPDGQGGPANPANPAGQAGHAGRSERRPDMQRGYGGPRPSGDRDNQRSGGKIEKDDDGTTYNPFAELLKGKK
ncbi:MAG TPA: S1 RNA-binding domain-containing protein, partial [Spirochaetales bacterium]|nr:S1 RNA-binding domain-containing protein [Spirochaetales bacterium]